MTPTERPPASLMEGTAREAASRPLQSPLLQPSHSAPAMLPPPPPRPPPLPKPYGPINPAGGRGPLASLRGRNTIPVMSPPPDLQLIRTPSSRVDVFYRPPKSQAEANLRLEGRPPDQEPGLVLPTPSSSTQPVHDDDDQQQKPSASSTTTEEGGGAGGGADDSAVTIDITNPDESLRQKIRIDIDSVPRGGGADDEKSRWICRVHPSIREKEGDAYQPKLVSIGPLHHGEPSLLPMEATKKRYVRTLLARSPESNTLEGYIAAIRGVEDRARKEYPEKEIRGRFDSDAFATMLLVDGCFVIEYMLREFFRQKQDEGEWGSLHNLERDLMLLENQIPFFVLQELFRRTRAPAGPKVLTTPQWSPSPSPLVEIALHFLGVEADHSKGIKADDVHHLLHLRHMCWQLRDVPLTATSRCSWACHAVLAALSYPVAVIKHVFLCLLFVLLVNEWPWSRHEPDLLKKIPCAADLDMAGVKFRRKVLRRSSIMEQYRASCNISFRRGEGVLEIPFVAVGQTLNARLRNFIALEQCQRDGLPGHYAAYVSFMNSIIYTPADVAVLRKYGVIEISFGSDEDVAKMFKSIYEDTNLYKVEITQISRLSKQVNAYCDVAYHRWRGRLRSSYLRSPWSAVALLAGGIMIGLTATQTIFTIRQSYKYNNN